ncbi:hypothetical protein JOM56_002754 [Amanita muscaria]
MASTNGRNGDVDALVRHAEYYLPDGNLHLLVENTHFRIHSFFFARESERFRAIFEKPVSPGCDREGTSDSNAIIIRNVSPEHFAKFLWVFYDPKYSRATTVEDWTIILDFAHKWGFGEVKMLAINSLQKLDIQVISRIALYQMYDASDEILYPHYATVCARPETLTTEEIKILGPTTAIMIFTIREKLLSTQPGIKPLDKIEPKIFQKCVGSYFNSQKKKAEQKKDGKHGYCQLVWYV